MSRIINLVVVIVIVSVMTILSRADEKEGEVGLFNGKDFSGWTFTNDDAKGVWKVVSNVKVDPKDPTKLVGEGAAAGGEGKGVLLVTPVTTGGSIVTEKTFGDVEFHGEFLVPRDGNTGVFFMGRYEVQSADSFGVPDKDMTELQCGGIPWTKTASTNACAKPGEWQTYHIVFRAPRFDAAGKKTQNARFVSVTLNGKKIHENVEVPEPTGGGLEGEEKPTGPILLQGDEGHGAWRNVRVKPVKLD
jgi:hypothetical protein